MPHYVQFSNGGVFQAILSSSTPPVGYHSAEAAKRLAEFDAAIGQLPPEQRAEHAPSRVLLQADLDNFRQQESQFMAALDREGLELYEVPSEAELAGMYEDIDAAKPERGKRINPVFAARAKTWRKLSQIVQP
jgi:hypothetical protein